MLALTLGAVSEKERLADGWFDLLRISARPARPTPPCRCRPR